MKDRKNKTVSFNENDEWDIELLNHAEKLNPKTGKPRNFSKYVKKLIEQDLNQENGNLRIVQNDVVIEEKDPYTKEAMKGFL